MEISQEGNICTPFVLSAERCDNIRNAGIHSIQPVISRATSCGISVPTSRRSLNDAHSTRCPSRGYRRVNLFVTSLPLASSGNAAELPLTHPRPGSFLARPAVQSTVSISLFNMRTRSRQGAGGGKSAEGEAKVAPTPRSPPRSTKKRRAPETSAAAPAGETKKPKGVASAAAVATPPSKAEKTTKGASLQESKKSTPSKASKEAGSRGKGKALEDQSLTKDPEADAATAGLIGVAPKGRCVSGRDWKARNQSQR